MWKFQILTLTRSTHKELPPLVKKKSVWQPSHNPTEKADLGDESAWKTNSFHAHFRAFQTWFVRTLIASFHPSIWRSMSSHIWWSDVIFRAHLMQVRLVQSLSTKVTVITVGAWKLPQTVKKPYIQLFQSTNESKLAITNWLEGSN